jgi:DNA polymerase/3'-5' exonuclease PolX
MNAADPILAPKRYERTVAIQVAKDLHTHLEGTFERIKVVGSVRRGKTTVKDLELLYIPHTIHIPDPQSLLGETIHLSAVNHRLDELVRAGVLVKRPKLDGTLTWGEDIRLAIHVESGLPVDFFAARPANWWNLLVCRTGGAESNKRICDAAIARNLKWRTNGAGFHNRSNDQLARTVRSERDVFEIVGLPYLEPHQRP